MKASLGCEKMTADGVHDMGKRGQLFTRSFRGGTSEDHETYLSEPMLPTVDPHRDGAKLMTCDGCYICITYYLYTLTCLAPRLNSFNLNILNVEPRSHEKAKTSPSLA